MENITFVSSANYYFWRLKESLLAKISLIVLGTGLLGGIVHVVSGSPDPTISNVATWSGVTLFFAGMLVLASFLFAKGVEYITGNDQYGSVAGAAIFILLLVVLIVWVPESPLERMNGITSQFWAYPALVGVVVLMAGSE